MSGSTGAGARTRPGFSLTELMVSIVILAVGVLGMGGLMGANSRMQRISTAHVDMVQLAESKLDSLRAVASAGTTIAGGSGVNSVAGTRQYTVSWTVANTGPAGTTAVTVTVAPYQQAEGPANLVITTLFE